MAFFQLTSPVVMQQYPFDYHSHFGGILPVEGRLDASVDYEVSYQPPKGDQVTVKLPKGQRLSLIGIMGGTGEHALDEGAVVLFDLALQMMIESGNPLNSLASKTNKAQYERGECAAESIYVASVVLARRWALSPSLINASASSPELYEEIRGQLRTRVQADGVGPYNPELLKILRYFNNKIYSANKYTPFDDCYKTRSSMMKAVLRDPKYAGRYEQWMLATYAFLYQSGVRCNQAAMGADEIELADRIAQSFNKQYSSNYRLLVHTSAGYMPGERLSAELNEKILPLLTSQGPSTVIGIDLLGTETKVADFGQFFKFLFDSQAKLSANFGTAKTARSQQLICHVHCGEGAASTTDNRSMIGYYYSNAAEPPGEDFYRAYSAYIARGVATAQGRLSDEPRGSRGAGPRKKSDVSGLFDELFRSDSLTHGGCTLRRFDINSPASIAIVAYNGKRSEMAMSETLDSTLKGQSQSWYAFFSGSPQFAIRLGHAFYYRNYMAQRYPLVAFDTNMGSNAITGASGLFDSVEGYRINRGFRHLDGYIDTDVLHQAGNAVAYLGANALTQAQVEQFIAMVRAQTSLADVLNNEQNKGWLYGELTTGMAPICNAGNIASYYKLYSQIVLQLADQTTIKSYWFDALTRVLTLFCNWRSYLLGADGQGVEHTDVQDEFLRMVILLAYQLLPAGQTRVLDQTMVSLQELVLAIATDYWKTTVDPSLELTPATVLGLESMYGFKSPASVVTLTRSKPAEK